MSIKAMNWAWEQQLPPVPKLTLLALADNADDHGYCWPKMRTIAAKCCTSERTIQRTIKSLLNTGLLNKEARFDGAGRQVSNSYTLALAYPDKLSPPIKKRGNHGGEGGTGGTPGMTKLCQGGSDEAMSPLEPPYEPSKEPSGPSREQFPQLNALESQKISRLLGELPTDEQGTVTALLLDALTKGSIQTSPSRWLRAVIRRQGHQQHPQTALPLSEAAYVERLVQGGIAAEDAWRIAKQTFRNREASSTGSRRVTAIPQRSMKSGGSRHTATESSKSREKKLVR